MPFSTPEYTKLVYVVRRNVGETMTIEKSTTHHGVSQRERFNRGKGKKGYYLSQRGGERGEKVRQNTTPVR